MVFYPEIKRMAISIKAKKIKGFPVLSITGRLVSIDSEKFQKKLENFCKKTNMTAIIDISEVNFIDSYALGTLVQHHTQLRKEGRRLILLNTNTNPTTYIQRLFEMTGLKRVFNFISSIDQIQ